jgi:hypothetical protein
VFSTGVSSRVGGIERQRSAGEREIRLVGARQNNVERL